MTGRTKPESPCRARHDAVRRAATLVPVPWKNGGGTTSEIAVWPRAASFDDFVWRVSVAEIAQDGAFSDFPGIDRTIVLLDGAGMDLEHRAETSADMPPHPTPAHPAPARPTSATPDRHALREPYVPLSFDGAIRWHARLVGGPTQDFNLMVRRGAVRGMLTIWHGAGTFTPPADSVLLFVAHGTATLHERGAAPVRARVLERFDSVQPGASRRPALTVMSDAMSDAIPHAIPHALSDVTLDAGAVMLVVGITAQIDADADAHDATASRTAHAGTHAAGASSAATAS